jgi:hypothetical protein
VQSRSIVPETSLSLIVQIIEFGESTPYPEKYLRSLGLVSRISMVMVARLWQLH